MTRPGGSIPTGMPTPRPIQRLPLAQQVAERIEQELRAGTWAAGLPSERELCAQLLVSRPVLRQGLSFLVAAGRLAAEARRGYRVVATSGSAARKVSSQEVRILAPVPVVRLRHFTNLWLDELRRQLYALGYGFSVHDGAQYASHRPDRALERLLRHHSAACWILVHSGVATQSWFARQHLPAVVIGSVHPGVRLPCVKLDVAAAARHAAGMLRRLGHRQLAFLSLKPERAGDHESEDAFLAAAGGAGRIAHHDGTPDDIERALGRLLLHRPRITGLLVGHSHTYLTAVGVLARGGLRVPEDVSIICREDDPFLEFLRPVPARYHVDHVLCAKRLCRAVVAAGRRQVAVHRPLIPQFINGGSIRAAAR